LVPNPSSEPWISSTPVAVTPISSTSTPTRLFVPNMKHALIITMSDYVGNFAPLPTSQNDGKEIMSFLQGNGFTTEWIHNSEDGKKIEDQFEQLISKARQLGNSNQRGLFFVYYSGHGSIIDGLTVGHTTHNFDVPLEARVRKLTIYANSYVVAFFDCCREVTGTPISTKGGPIEAVAQKLAGQLCIVHAVAPTKKAVTVRSQTGVSEVTQSFLSVLRQAKQTFPSCIQQWAKGHRTVELIDKCPFEVQLTKEQTEMPESLNLPPLAEWTCNDVANFMHTLNLTQDYSTHVHNNGIDGSALNAIVEGEMTWQEAGFTAVGDIAKLKKGLKAHK